MNYTIYDGNGNVVSSGGNSGGSGGAGTPGTNGTNGLSVLSGVGAPANSLGVDGQPGYLDTSTGQLYGAKANGAWPAVSFTPLTWLPFMSKLTGASVASARQAFNIVTRNTINSSTAATSGYVDAALPFAATLRQLTLVTHSVSSDVNRVLYLGRSAAGSPIAVSDYINIPISAQTQSGVLTQTWAQGDSTASFSAGDIVRPSMGFGAAGATIDMTLYLFFAAANVV